MRPFGIFLTGLALVVGCGEKIEVEREIHAQTGQVITEYEYYHHPETHEKVKHGYHKTYHVAGKKGYREVGNYNHGKKAGVWTYYQENGNKYLDLILKGDNEQRFTFYYKNGNKKYEGKTKNGLREGFWTFYRESEKKESEGIYKKAKREGFWTFYDENGKKESEGNWKDDKQEGLWRFYHPNGKKREDVHRWKKRRRCYGL